MKGGYGGKKSDRHGGGGGGESRGAERQKVRSREVLMAVCRAALWSMQDVVGAQGSARICGRN